MIINNIGAKHIVIRDAKGDDVIYIGEDEVINDSKGLTVYIRDEYLNEIDFYDKPLSPDK